MRTLRGVLLASSVISAALLGGATAATAQPFTLPRFPVGEPGVTAYTAPMIAVLDHSGRFYTNCCDSEIVAYTGERALREDGAVGCGDDTFPACFFGLCICAYGSASGEPWTVTGSYIGSFGGTSFLLYDGHAGYDYSYGFGTPLLAPRAGRLCKARSDLVNGSFGASSAWAKFHTYYIDHGVFDGVGYATWYLHASDLETPELQELGVGLCADVNEGQVVARVGNQGTFAPHLHFEARTYDPAEGPEGASSRVIDPYGWTGQDPDPWENEAENPQAAHRALPLWEDEKCNPFGPVECGACEQCDFALGCVVAPATACKAAEGGSLKLRDADDDTRDRLQWNWRKGPATESSEFGDPTMQTSYDVCLYGEAGPPELLLAARAPAAGECPKRSGTESCWRARGDPPGSAGYRYRDKAGTPDGLLMLELRPGPDRKARIDVRGAGEPLDLPALPTPVPVRIQLQSSDGACWESTYSADGVRRSSGTRFKARTD